MTNEQATTRLIFHHSIRKHSHIGQERITIADVVRHLIQAGPKRNENGNRRPLRVPVLKKAGFVFVSSVLWLAPLALTDPSLKLPALTYIILAGLAILGVLYTRGVIHRPRGAGVRFHDDHQFARTGPGGVDDSTAKYPKSRRRGSPHHREHGSSNAPAAESQDRLVPQDAVLVTILVGVLRGAFIESWGRD